MIELGKQLFIWERGGFSEESTVILVWLYMSYVSCFGFLCFSYRPIGRDPFCVRVGIDLCTIGACFCHQRRLSQTPMLPR